MVKRHDFDDHGCPEIFEREQGDYVLYSDYAALEAERDELQRKQEAMLNALDNPYWVGLPYEPAIGAVRQIAAKCRAIAEGQ